MSVMSIYNVDGIPPAPLSSGCEAVGCSLFFLPSLFQKLHPKSYLLRSTQRLTVIFAFARLARRQARAKKDIIVIIQK